MPVDSSIALSGKPPVLPEVDVNKLFLTLSQMKYLNSETARTEAASRPRREPIRSSGSATRSRRPAGGAAGGAAPVHPGPGAGLPHRRPDQGRRDRHQAL